MNIRTWHDETTLPLPLLTGAAHQREFANTAPFVHDAYAPAYEHAKQTLAEGCSACNGACPTPAACELPIARATRPPRAAFWLLRAITAVRLALLRWNLECLREERDLYSGLGWVGPVYMRNSWQEELRLRRAIRDLTT